MLRLQFVISLLKLIQSTSMRNEKNSQVARFANLSEDQLQQILEERHALGTKKVTNWSLTTFKGKISVFIVVFKFVQPGNEVYSY